MRDCPAEVVTQLANQVIDNAALTGRPEPVTYRPPLEKTCPTCGGKFVGRCSLNSCNGREFR